MGEQSKELMGGCACGHIRYKTTSNPFIVHCCHCRQCQRLSGAAFAINALFEASHIRIQQGEPEITTVNTPSGKGQKISRCPKCKVAVWSNYYMSGIQDLIRFVRVGTLDNPDHLPPDVHIYTASKQPWIQLPEDILAVEAFYDFETMWSPEYLERRVALLALAEEERSRTN